jgi:transposase-like protein
MDFLSFNAKFPTEKAVVDHYVRIRYHNVITCPHCGEKVYVYRRRKLIKVVQCKNCNNSFSVLKGTIFEHSSTNMIKWFYAIHLFLNAKKGISGYQLQREIKVTYKCAWRILKQLRFAMGNEKNQRLFRTIVEIDETYVGGKPRRIYDENNNVLPKEQRQIKRGRGTKKIPVVGIKERKSGMIYARVMSANEEGKKLSGKQLIAVLDAVCRNKTKVITDDFRGYDILDKETEKGYKRFVVNHSIGQYSAGKGIHTNGIENFWSILKRGWYGIYHHISVKYLQYYVNEFCFRNNHKNDINPFNSLLRQALIKEPERKSA